MRTHSLVLCGVLLAGCSSSGQREPNFDPPGGKGDSLAPGDTAADDAVLDCYLEYERFEPFEVAPIGQAFLSQDSLDAGVTIHPEGPYSLHVVRNPTPPYNLTFVVSMLDAAGDVLAYTVLPEPSAAGTPYLFELGAEIDATGTVGDAGFQEFDHLRAYCGWIGG